MRRGRTDKTNQPQITLLLGEKDRVIAKKKMALLAKELGGCELYVVRGMGHTMVVEDYEGLLRLFWPGETE